MKILERSVAEWYVRWQVEMCAVTFVAARALRLVRWRRTANVLAKGSGLAIASGAVYLQVRGRKHLQERVAKFYDEANKADELGPFVGGEKWKDFDRWVEACGCLQPFPIPLGKQDVVYTKKPKDLGEVVTGWKKPRELKIHPGLVAANLGKGAFLALILLRLG